VVTVLELLVVRAAAAQTIVALELRLVVLEI
jgi:hypothetical protein